MTQTTMISKSEIFQKIVVPSCGRRLSLIILKTIVSITANAEIGYKIIGSNFFKNLLVFPVIIAGKNTFNWELQFISLVSDPLDK